MSNDEQTKHDDNTYSRKPNFVAYNVQPSRDGKGYWNRIGAAWAHKDGRGHEIQLDSLPVDGRVTLREMRQDRMQAYEEAHQAQEMQPHDHAPTPDHSRDRAR